jgi:hypothetical protein
MAFLESSLPPSLGPFINYFIIICVLILSVSQDGLLLLIKFLKFISVGGAKAIPASLGKSVLNATYCKGKTLEFRAEAFLMAS